MLLVPRRAKFNDMNFLFELIFELIPGKVWGFIFAVLFIVAGVYLWTGNNEERARYDLATNDQSRSVMAEVRRKTIRSEATSGLNKHDSGSGDVNYLVLIWEEGDKYESVDVQVDRDEYDAVKEGQNIQINFNPADPSYVVTPGKTRPGVFWFRVGGGIFIGLGILFVLMLLISLF